MRYQTLDIELAGQILRNFSRLTGVKANCRPVGMMDTFQMVGGRVRLELAGNEVEVAADLLENIQFPDFPNLIIQRDRNGKLLALAKTILPKFRKELQRISVNYIDGFGNSFIKLGPLFISIDGRREEISGELSAKPFSKACLKVIFQLLKNDHLVNGTSREIERITGLSSTPVHQTITRLKELDFLLPGDDHKLRWNKKRKLLERWLIEYNSYLKPGQWIGNFKFADHEISLNWRTFHFPDQSSRWGGEPAAQLLTGDNGQPELFTIYAKENKQDLIHHFGLIPDIRGNIEIYRSFWNSSELPANTVTPLLVYTDLVNSGNTGNIELAQKIYNLFLIGEYE